MKNKNLLKFFKSLGKKYNADKVVIFGSQARKDAGKLSDYDVCFFGIKETSYSQLFDEVEYDAPSLLKIDLVHWENIPPKLKDNIKKEGVIIYERN